MGTMAGDFRVLKRRKVRGWTTAEFAEAVGCSRQRACARLAALRKRGLVVSEVAASSGRKGHPGLVWRVRARRPAGGRERVAVK
jgi:predicted ArsR family transcriptional regulator